MNKFCGQITRMVPRSFPLTVCAEAIMQGIIELNEKFVVRDVSIQKINFSRKVIVLFSN